MTLEKKLFEEIYKDLKEDFPEIESIIQQEDETIKITGDDDTLWAVFETLYNGVTSIEFNAGKEEQHYLLVII
jgi:hypothetical protein